MASGSAAGSSPFSAADSALGYLYQVRVALLWALRRLKDGNEFLVSLETLDDVAFETRGGRPEELLQTKHHRSRSASLTDASADLWKTLRVWFEGHAANSIPLGTSLHLLTTTQASSGSVAAHLRAKDGRDVDAALASLEATAQSSTSAENAPAYAAFLKAPGPTRRALVGSVVIIDAASDVSMLGRELRAEVFWAVERDHQDAFLERIEGWWFRRTLKQMVSIGLGDRILGVEIEAQMSELRQQFKHDALPIDDDLLNFDLDDGTHAAHATSTFVRQLELVTVGKKRIAAAIRDYYRAFHQRSRWVRDELLLVGDLAKYERSLLEEWEIVFEGVCDELGAGAADEAKRAAALEVLKWAERTSLPIRPNVMAPFVTRGSLHMLADDARVGWHPDFRDRLAALLGESGGDHDAME
jgi:hypothetical protein